MLSISQMNSLEGLVVFSLAVVKQTELQESGTVVVAQSRGRCQILDGLLRVAHSHVTLCSEFPRLGIPRGNLQAHSNFHWLVHKHSETLTEVTFTRHEMHLYSSPQQLYGCTVVSLVICSVRLLLQLLQLMRFHQLLLSLLAVRGTLQLKTLHCVSVRERSKDLKNEFQLGAKPTTASKSSLASCVLPCFRRMFPLCKRAWKQG